MRTADLWVRLMEGLGYSRFGAQGSDAGAFVSSQLGHRYPEHVLGIHLTFPMPLDANTNPNSIPTPDVPTGVTIMPKDVVQMPRSWAEQYYDLRSWNVLPSGGHFAHMEQPELLVKDIRNFFRPLRSQLG